MKQLISISFNIYSFCRDLCLYLLKPFEYCFPVVAALNNNIKTPTEDYSFIYALALEGFSKGLKVWNILNNQEVLHLHRHLRKCHSII